MESIKQAIVLAAGKGTRLDRPESPKPLVAVGHKPLIIWTLERLAEAGITRAVVVVGFGGDSIKKELIGNPAVKIDVEFIDAPPTGDLLQSVLAARGFVTGPCIVTASDLISSFNPYAAITRTALAPDQIVTLVSSAGGHAERSGAHSKIKRAGAFVAAIGRDLAAPDGVELGVYAFGDSALADLGFLAREKAYAIKTFEDALNDFASRGKLAAADAPDAEWYDVNTPATLVRAEIFVRKNFYAAAPTPGGGSIQKAVPLEPHFTFFRDRRMQSAITIERGLIDRLHETVPVAPDRYQSPHFLLTDTTVDALHADRVIGKLRAAGLAVQKIVMPSGEHAKTVQTLIDLSHQIFAHGLDEGSILFNVGGGVVNNMAGLLAATLYRGIGLVHIPTTTMAQLDAAIDFKQAVNSTRGKNLLGAYYPATHILIDPDALATLPERHLRNGIAEALKHALAQDADFSAWLMRENRPVQNPSFLEELTRRTIGLKVPLLNGDPADDYNEMAPQYGHAVGHAVEHLSGYELLHGEAVSIGMCVSAEVARLLGIAADAVVDEHYALLERYRLPTRVPDAFGPEDITNVIRYDKHYLGKLPRLGLVGTIGSLWRDQGTTAIPIDFPVLERAIKINKSRAV